MLIIKRNAPDSCLEDEHETKDWLYLGRSVAICGLYLPGLIFVVSTIIYIVDPNEKHTDVGQDFGFAIAGLVFMVPMGCLLGLIVGAGINLARDLFKRSS